MCVCVHFFTTPLLPVTGLSCLAFFLLLLLLAEIDRFQGWGARGEEGWAISKINEVNYEVRIITLHRFVNKFTPRSSNRKVKRRLLDAF